MAVRLFEGKDHAAAYLQYRIGPHELISRIMGYMEKKVSVYLQVFSILTGCNMLILVLLYVAYNTPN